MALHLLHDPGTPLDAPCWTWKDLAPAPLSKLDDDAFTRVRAILMAAMARQALSLHQEVLRTRLTGRETLAALMRASQYQASAAAWLLSADHSPLEATLAHEQAGVETLASLAQLEEDPAMAQSLRFMLLDGVDHLYRHAALLDRLEGKDANNILQGYTDIVPGRPTSVQHRAPDSDLVAPCDAQAGLATRLHALTAQALAVALHGLCMAVGPQFTDPVARLLYAEVASAQCQHLVHCACVRPLGETPLQTLALQHIAVLWCAQACAQQEVDARLRALWERFTAEGLGQWQAALSLLRQEATASGGEPALDALLVLLDEGHLPPGPAFKSHRAFIRQVLAAEVSLCKDGPRFAAPEQEPVASLVWRNRMNATLSPSQAVAAGYRWTPGTELNRDLARVGQSAVV